MWGLGFQGFRLLGFRASGFRVIRSLVRTSPNPFVILTVSRNSGPCITLNCISLYMALCDPYKYPYRVGLSCMPPQTGHHIFTLANVPREPCIHAPRTVVQSYFTYPYTTNLNPTPKNPICPHYLQVQHVCTSSSSGLWLAWFALSFPVFRVQALRV